MQAGIFFTIEFALGFHVGFVGTYNGQQKLIMDGPGIARYYVLKGNFPVDILAVIAWVAQVGISQWLRVWACKYSFKLCAMCPPSCRAACT